MLCKQCNKEFIPKRASSSFCSTACRSKSHRTLSKPNANANAKIEESLPKIHINEDAQCRVSSPDANATKEEREMFHKILDHYDDTTPVVPSPNKF